MYTVHPKHLPVDMEDDIVHLVLHFETVFCGCYEMNIPWVNDVIFNEIIK